jgi:hypothetical protein
MKTMSTRIVAVILLSLTFVSCEKAEQFIQKAVLTQIITNDRWVVETFSVSGTDVTTEYTPYEFEFNKNGIVTAFEATGTIVGDWKEDMQTLSIQTHFNNPNNVLGRFNNVWFISKSAATYVEARAITPNAIYNLRLVKKQ